MHIIHKDGKTTIKERNNTIPRYTQILTQKPLQVIFSLKIIFLFSDLSIEVFLANTTPVYYTSFSSFLAGLDRRHDPLLDHPSGETRSSTW